MRKYFCLTGTLFFLLLIFHHNLFAQAARADSSSQQYALNNAINLFYSSEREEAPIYNGKEYYFYDPTIKGTAYYADVKAFTPGTAVYDGVVYNNVLMLYDLYKDEVVVLLYNHFSKFSLVNQKVKSFDFLTRHFVNINADTLANTSELKTGFYDQLYAGKTEVLEKQIKNIQVSNGGQNGPESYFNFFREFYVKRGLSYYKFSSQGSLLDILKDKKKELERYIKTSKIKFRKDPEDAMVKIATYYDHLTN